MGPIAVWVALLLVNIWATSFVARHIPAGTERTLLFVLIWLIPGGVVIAIPATISRGKRNSVDTKSRMLEAIVEKNKQIRDPD